MNEKTPYEILGVGRHSTQKEIKKRYIELCKVYHPDVANSNSKIDFKEITVAYDLLTKKKNQLIRANSQDWRYTQSAGSPKPPINTAIWTKRSCLFGLGILVFTYICFNDNEPTRHRKLPHEIKNNNSSSIKHNDPANRKHLEDSLNMEKLEKKDEAPWKASGVSFREWRKS